MVRCLNYVLLSIWFGAITIECASNEFRLSPEQLVVRYQLECIEETRVDPDVILRVRKGSWIIPQDKVELVKEWTLCVMMKAGLMTKEGVYLIDVALQQVPHEERREVEDLIDKCLSQKAIPARDIAFNFAKCYQKISRGSYTVSAVLPPPRRNAERRFNIVHTDFASSI
ncbi:uncharacterized protein LOC113499439 [Trichoplusia ni]|uniref:Uncharacterized protein LOC113499439 n=1 Tax=Trichoplusia ni TaxID=7111 RepID=A0A7E5W509_TRINI|nr:uncharacterized protein LOC113499439 [Trichoplusia ni]